MTKLICLVFGLGLLTTTALAELPVRLRPANPRWLEWRGPTQVFTTSAEYCLKGLKRESVSSKGKPVELVGPDFTDGLAVRIVRN